MPFTRYYHSELNFILTRVFGFIDDGQVRRHVLDLNQEAEGRLALNELADCTGVDPDSNLTVEATLSAANLERGQPRAREGRLVLVAPESPAIFGMARAYATIAGDVRESTWVTRSYEEALNWLGYRGELLDDLMRFIHCA